jgi:hypothetical protein
MKTIICTACSKAEEINDMTYKKRIERGTALKCRECLFDRTVNRHYSDEINHEIWEQIRVAYGIKGARERLVRF